MLEKRIRLSQHLSIGPQPTEAMLRDLKKRGFKTVVNLRNKGEFDQVFSPEEEKEMVESLDMEYMHIPVFLANISPKHVEEFIGFIEEGSKPVYVHCRIGQRSVPLSLIYHAIRKKLTTEHLFLRADKLGIDFSSPFMRNFVENYLNRLAEQQAAG